MMMNLNVMLAQLRKQTQQRRTFAIVAKGNAVDSVIARIKNG